MNAPLHSLDRRLRPGACCRAGPPGRLAAGDRGGGGAEHVLASCGHSPHLERPAEFTNLVTDFLATADS